jgi:hypothetical protein
LAQRPQKAALGFARALFEVRRQAKARLIPESAFFAA